MATARRLDTGASKSDRRKERGKVRRTCPGGAADVVRGSLKFAFC